MEKQDELTRQRLAAFAQDNAEAPAQAARFLKSLAHPDRLKLLCSLLDGPLGVTAIAAEVGANQSTVSQHLGRLRDAGLVQASRDGRQVHYSIADPVIQQLIGLLYLRFCSPPAAP